MPNFRKSFGIVLLILLFAARTRAHVAAEEMAEAAQNLVEGLKPEQREKAMFEIKAGERVNWNFVPMNRKGLTLKEMTKEQRDAVHGLLDAALSHSGYVKTTTIMSLETVLFDLENKNPKRDPGLYYISIFGTPEAKGTWGWRFEGHHLSINFTIVDGQEISGTPTFMGTNPGEIKEGPRKGLRVLAAEEDLGRQLVNLLDEDQKKLAIFSSEAPKEIFTKNDRTARGLEPAGVPLEKMNKEQSEVLIKLVKEYLYRYREEIADDDWQKIKKNGLEKISFAWAGGLDRGQGHYYRVQGPTFLLEYDNTQNDANHVHTVWRGFENDFGDDVLKKHYEQVSHEKEAPVTDNNKKK